MAKFTVYVALLRGINVGGSNKIAMADLISCFERLGYDHVRTYINSGNVIFSAPSTNARAIELQIEKALDATFSLPIRVIIRSVQEMRQVVQAMPPEWGSQAADLKCDVIFVRHTIDSPKLLERFHVNPAVEELIYHPGVLLWSVKSKDFSRSGFTKVNQMDIYQDMTVRGPNSVRKIYELMQQLPGVPAV